MFTKKHTDECCANNRTSVGEQKVVLKMFHVFIKYSVLVQY